MKAANSICWRDFDKESREMDQDSPLFYASYYGAGMEGFHGIFVENFPNTLREKSETI